MPELESPNREGAETAEGNRASIEKTSLDGIDGTVEVPDDATESEAAAIVVAIGTHLSDRERAAAAAARAAETETRRTDEWVLASRLRSNGNRHWPRDVERGNEWRAAARSF